MSASQVPPIPNAAVAPATISFRGKAHPIIQCADTGNALFDTCVSKSIAVDINGYGFLLFNIILVCFMLKKASMAG